MTEHCLGKSSCSIEASNDEFGVDPCHLTTKQLSVAVSCASLSEKDQHKLDDDAPVIRAWQVRSGLAFGRIAIVQAAVEV